MNIIYISTVFPRENENSNIYTDLAEKLVEKGNSITVVAAEEKRKIKNTYINSERGCTVLRVKTGNIYDVNMIEKGLSFVFLKYQLKYAIKEYLKNNKYDMVLFESPPVTMEGVVKFVKDYYHIPAFLIMKDIFPQNAIDIGIMKKNSLIYRFFRKKEKKVYSLANKIGCMSKGNCAYIEFHNPEVLGKTELFPNTKRIQDKLKPINKTEIRKEFDINEEAVVFIFGGNMGKPQAMGYLCDVIGRMCEEERAYFVLVGRGTEKEMVKQKIGKQSNVLLLENLERTKYEYLVRACDVGIVSLDSRFTIPNYPSRILSYMEYEMPVLAATDMVTDFRDLIIESECGKWCCSDSVNDMIVNMTYMIEYEDERIKMGKNGRKYLLEKFSVERSVTILNRFFKQKNNE